MVGPAAKHANIGVRTGGPSEVFVLDVDGLEGERSLSQLLEIHGQLPETWQAFTGRGRHWYFKQPSKSKIPCSRSKIGVNLDIKADGGYVVAPPSLHSSGKRYEWKPGHAPWESSIADAPAWLIRLIEESAKTSAGTRESKPRQKGKETLKGQEAARYQHPAVESKIPFHQPIPKGMRKVTIFSRATYLRDTTNATERTVLAICLGLNAMLCKPPLEEKVVKSRVTSAFKDKKRRRPCRKPQLYMDEGPMKVYEYLREEAGMNWICRSKKEIAAATGLSERHIIDCIKTLEKWGLLDVQRGSGKGRKSLYLPKPTLQVQLEKGEERVKRLNSLKTVFSDSSLSLENSALKSNNAPARRLSVVK